MRTHGTLAVVAVAIGLLAIASAACDGNDDGDGDLATAATPADSTPAEARGTPAASGEVSEGRAGIEAVGDSEVAGEATITRLGDGTRVVVSIVGGLEEGTYQNGIYHGSCSEPTGESHVALADLDAGIDGSAPATTTTVDPAADPEQNPTYDHWLAEEHYVAVLAADGSVVGCGDVEAASRFALVPPATSQAPGSCAVFAEEYCRLGERVEFRDPHTGSVTTYVAFRLPEGVSIFAPFAGNVTGSSENNALNPNASTIHVSVPGDQRALSFSVSGDLTFPANYQSRAFFVDGPTGPFTVGGGTPVQAGQPIGHTTKTGPDGILFFRDSYSILLEFTYIDHADVENGIIVTATDADLLQRFFPDPR